MLSFLLPIARAITLPLRQPGEGIVNLSTPSPAATISSVYNFALGIGALVAFGIIVYAALEYTTTESSSRRQEAQGRIYQALLGLLLLLGASVVLRFINPDLPQLRNPELQELPAVGVGPSTAGDYWVYQICPAGFGCTDADYDTAHPDEHGHYSTKGDCEIAAGNENGGTSPSNWRCIQKTAPVGTAGPDCSPIASGPGSVEDIQSKLAGTPYEGCFGSQIEKASGVIRVESGGNPAAQSGSDKCSPGPQSVSIGLFQINLTAHDIGSLKCAYYARQPGQGAFGGQFRTSPNDCPITNTDRYNQCVAAASDPVQNIIEACKTFKARHNSFELWGPETKRKCGI